MWPWKPSGIWPFKAKPPKPAGQRGEDAAAQYLRRKGFKILERNAVYGRNELDIIARDRGVLVFVEVRSRTADDGIPPQDSIGPEKQRRVRRAAEAYLKQLGPPTPECRIDVIAVLLLPGEKPRITHLEAAF